MLQIDNSVRKVPVAKVNVDTPYLKGEVKAQVLPEAIYDLVIGNVAGARAPNDPDPIWQETCAVTTRAQAKRNSQPLKALKTFQIGKGSAVGKKELIEMQENDPTLEKFRTKSGINISEGGEVSFEVKDSVLYESTNAADQEKSKCFVR